MFIRLLIFVGFCILISPINSFDVSPALQQSITRIQSLLEGTKEEVDDKIWREYSPIPYKKKDLQLTTYDPKNDRYDGILPYESIRVILKKPVKKSTYINASPIAVKRWNTDNNPIRFIATQGPSKYTIEAFWNAVFQENASVIVMLTNVKESMKKYTGEMVEVPKCDEYWPKTNYKYIFEGKTNYKLKFSGLEVVMTESTELGQGKKPIYGHIRKFKLTKINTWGKPVSIFVTQYHFLDLIDHSAPNGSEIKFWTFVQDIKADAQNALEKNPNATIMAHCSAGVGRTGMFLLVFTMILQAEANVALVPNKTTEEMREQRHNLVYNPTQYEFALRFVLKMIHDGKIKPLVEAGKAHEQQPEWHKIGVEKTQSDVAEGEKQSTAPEKWLSKARRLCKNLVCH